MQYRKITLLEDIVRDLSSLAPFFSFSIYYPSINMTELFVDIVAPNGRRYVQPTGLFINNEFVPASNAGTIISIDPAYVSLQEPFYPSFVKIRNENSH